MLGEKRHKHLCFAIARDGKLIVRYLPGRGGKRMAKKPRKMSVEHIIVVLVGPCNPSRKRKCQKG